MTETWGGCSGYDERDRESSPPGDAEDSTRTTGYPVATTLLAISYPASTDLLAILAKVRSDVFAVLRRHDVHEQCFAEVAMITHAAISAVERSAPITGE